MDDAVDEEGRCAPHLAGRQSALDVATNTRLDFGAGSVAIEACDVEVELDGLPPQIDGDVVEHPAEATVAGTLELDTPLRDTPIGAIRAVADENTES